MTKNSSLYIFIIWDKSRKMTNEIMNDLKKKFIIRDVYEISWDKNDFEKNLLRFYGSLYGAQKKIELCGTGPFLLILLSDPDEKFRKLESKGITLANSNIYDSKIMYREWIGKEFSIHSSVSKEETNHDLTLLLGKNTEDVEKELKLEWDGSIKNLEENLHGHNGWDNLEELVYVLNGTCKYVILRNFDDLYASAHKHHDIDMLAEGIKTKYIINSLSKKLEKALRVNIDQKQVYFDVKYPVDHYIDIKWFRDILERRVLNNNGFYIPSREDYFYTLLFHLVYHKKQIPKKYETILEILCKEYGLKEFFNNANKLDIKNSKILLSKYMKKMGYQNSNSFKYKIQRSSIQYNFLFSEVNRLIKKSVLIIQKQGFKILILEMKNKLKLITNKPES